MNTKSVWKDAKLKRLWKLVTQMDHPHIGQEKFKLSTHRWMNIANIINLEFEEAPVTLTACRVMFSRALKNVKSLGEGMKQGPITDNELAQYVADRKTGVCPKEIMIKLKRTYNCSNLFKEMTVFTPYETSRLKALVVKMATENRGTVSWKEIGLELNKTSKSCWSEYCRNLSGKRRQVLDTKWTFEDFVALRQDILVYGAAARYISPITLRRKAMHVQKAIKSIKWRQSAILDEEIAERGFNYFFCVWTTLKLRG